MSGGICCTPPVAPEADRGRFDTLSADLRSAAASIVTRDCREITATAHDGFMTVSWSGDREYKLALEFEKAWRNHKKARTQLERSQHLRPENEDKERERIGTECRRRIPKGGPPHFVYECYVFHKSSDLIPPALEQMHPALVALFRRAPLHHFFLIERCEVRADHGGGKVFTEWSNEKNHASAGELIAALKARICPPPCPGQDDKEPTKFPHIPWAAIGFFVLALILAIILLVQGFLSGTADGSGNSTVLSGPTTSGQAVFEEAAPQSDLSRLHEEHAAMAAQLDALAGQPGEAAAMEQIAALAGTVAHLTEEIGGEIRTGGLDLPPCLPVRGTGGRRVPAYLFMAYVADAGITPVRLQPAAPAAGWAEAAAALPYVAAPPARPLTAAEFAAQSRPLFEASEAAGCRHFVMLVEDDPRDAGAYIANRQAVEDHFYIYRLRR